MNRNRGVIVVALVATAGLVVAGRLQLRRLAGLEAQLGAVSAARAADAERFEEEQRRLGALSRVLVAPPTARPGQTAAAANETDPAGPEESASDDKRKRSMPTHEDQVVNLDSVFSAEAPAADWAHDAEGVISAGLRDVGGNGSRVESVECRSSLCKATLVHDGEQQFQAFVEKAFSSSQFWTGASLSYRTPSPPGAPVVSTMFYARPGTDMPYLN